MRTIRFILFPAALLAASPVLAAASGTSVVADATRMTLILGLLAVIPTMVVATTSFLRIIIVLSMVRHAFGMPQTPPNAVLTTLALFMSAFIMQPTVDVLNRDALQPFLDGKIGVEQAMERSAKPLAAFMLQHTKESDIELVYAIAQAPLPDSPDSLSLTKLIPAFMLNELRVAFTIGFVVLLPFLLVDLVVSSVLLALGMMMVPPATISLPIKVLMFVLIDGWGLVMQGLFGSFQ